MKKRFEKAILVSSETRALFVLLVVLTLRARRRINNSFLAAINWLYYCELFIFPPLAFSSTFLATSKYFPPHPIRIFAVLSTAFMFSTLTLFLLRPRKWKRTAHWVRAQQ